MQIWSLILFGWLIAAIFLIPGLLIVFLSKNKGIISYLVSGVLTSLGTSIVFFYTTAMLIASHNAQQAELIEQRIGTFSLWLTLAALLCLITTIAGTIFSLHLYRKANYTGNEN